MKRLSIILLFALAVISAYADGLQDKNPTVYDQGFIRPYGMVAYKNMILVSNYGSGNPDGSFTKGKGYICAIQAGVVKPFIRADGHLSAPKGMAVYENLLFVTDINKIVVYNLKKIENPPVEINFPASENVLTDVIVVGTTLLVSVNDTGKIFGIDLQGASATKINSQAVLLASVPGAGNMAVCGNKLIVNSFCSDIDEQSTVYVGDLDSDEDNPVKPLMKEMSPGQYLGIAVSEDKSRIYLSTLKTEDIYRPALLTCPADASSQPVEIKTDFKFTSPASVMVQGQSLWILDHMQGRVYRHSLK